MSYRRPIRLVLCFSAICSSSAARRYSFLRVSALIKPTSVGGNAACEHNGEGHAVPLFCRAARDLHPAVTLQVC